MASKSGIEIKPRHEGNFHRWAGVAQGEPIPMSKIEQGLRSKNPRVRRMAQFAKNARGWHHKTILSSR
jgi:hypothetical protein